MTSTVGDGVVDSVVPLNLTLPFQGEAQRLLVTPAFNSLSAVSSIALLVTFALEASPGTLQPDALDRVISIELGLSGFFVVEFLARWWSVGCSPRALIRPLFVFDILNILPLLVALSSPSGCILAARAVAHSNTALSKTAHSKSGAFETAIWHLRLPSPRSPNPLPFLCATVSMLAIDTPLAPLRLLRALRILRLRRLLGKEELSTLARAVTGDPTFSVPESQRVVARVAFSVVAIVLISAGIEWQAEHLDNPLLSTYADAIYFSITTLTTVGFGYELPIRTHAAHA